MLDRPRKITLAWAALFLGLSALLAFAVTGERTPLGPLDDLGRQLEDWADEHDALREVLRFIETWLNQLPILVLTLVLAALLVARRHRRAAIYAVLVVFSTWIITSLLKVAIGRGRPEWQDTVGLVDSRSYPSGHTSANAALMAVLCVLASMLIRRAQVRRLVYVLCALEVAVIWVDRVLLGRHFPTDVLGGTFLAIGMALFWLAVFSPLPRSHAAHAEPLHEAVPSSRQLTVILNPSKVEDVDRFRSIVAAQAAESGWSEPTWLYTTVEDPGTGMAEAAAVSGADLVLVCGGDGTVREVCAELAGTGIPVGIVPAGTGNLLARNLAIPLFLRSAIDVALNGQDRAIDLVEVSGDGFEDTHFMVMAGMGLDAAIMEGVNEDIKRRVGWIAYVLSGPQGPDVTGREGGDRGRRRRVHDVQGGHRRGRQRRLPPGWAAVAARRRHRRRGARRGRAAPQALPLMGAARRAGAQQGQAQRRDDRAAHRPVHRRPRQRGHPPPARRRHRRPGSRAAHAVRARAAAGPGASLTAGQPPLP